MASPKKRKRPGVPGGSVTACIKRMTKQKAKRGYPRDPGALCASIADKREPGWRSRPRKKMTRKTNPTRKLMTELPPKPPGEDYGRFLRDYPASVFVKRLGHTLSDWGLKSTDVVRVLGSRNWGLKSKARYLPSSVAHHSFDVLVVGRRPKSIGTLTAAQLRSLTKGNPIIGAKKGNGVWKVMERGNSWWIYHPTRKAIRIGPIDYPHAKNYSKAVAAAEKRNKALATKRRNPVAKKPVRKTNPKKTAEAGFPDSFKRALTTLRRRAAKAETEKEAVSISNAGYKAYDKARAMADRSLWDSMDDAIKQIRLQAFVSAEKGAAKREAAGLVESRRLRIEAAREGRRQAELSPVAHELALRRAAKGNPKKTTPRRKTNPRKTTAKKNPRRLSALTRI